MVHPNPNPTSHLEHIYRPLAAVVSPPTSNKEQHFMWHFQPVVAPLCLGWRLIYFFSHNQHKRWCTAPSCGVEGSVAIISSLCCGAICSLKPSCYTCVSLYRWHTGNTLDWRPVVISLDGQHTSCLLSLPTKTNLVTRCCQLINITSLWLSTNHRSSPSVSSGNAVSWCKAHWLSWK